MGPGVFYQSTIDCRNSIVLLYKLSIMRYQREISNKIMRLSQVFPAVVVTGARQTGKSTLLRYLFPDYRYVSLDLPADAQLADEDPQAFLERYPPPLLIDEVQYAPKLFRHLKIAIDQDRKAFGRFILTGSQKFTLMKEVADSLAGRIGLCELESFSSYEIRKDFDQYLQEKGPTSVICRGLMPQLWDIPETTNEDFYRSYLATYIERDVRQILNISSLRDFDRFMRVCATRSAQILNKSEVAKEVGVTAKTINDWISVLEASNQILLLEPYFQNTGKRVVKSPKLYFADCGLLTYLLGLNPETLQRSPHIGAVWETFLYSELRKAFSILFPEGKIWFYRDQQREADFLLQHKGSFTLADAKWTENPTEKSFRPLREIQQYFSGADRELFVICRAPHRMPIKKHNYAINGFDLRNEWGWLST